MHHGRWWSSTCHLCHCVRSRRVTISTAPTDILSCRLLSRQSCLPIPVCSLPSTACWACVVSLRGTRPGHWQLASPIFCARTLTCVLWIATHAAGTLPRRCCSWHPLSCVTDGTSSAAFAAAGRSGTCCSAHQSAAQMAATVPNWQLRPPTRAPSRAP